LTEESEASEMLYRAMYLPRAQVVENPRNKHYRKNQLHGSKMNKLLSKELEAVNWKDEFDDALYEEAERIFYSRCQWHNITTLMIPKKYDFAASGFYALHPNRQIRYRQRSEMSKEEIRMNLAEF
jgi:hypothetical protein